MTIDEAAELLREARSVIRPIHTLDEATGHYRWFHDTLCQRIDAALSEHTASETPVFDNQEAWLEKQIVALEARVAEMEKRLATGFPVGVSITTGAVMTPRYCPKCGRHGTVKPTGNILTSMPPRTEMKCDGCQHKWGHRDGVR